MKRLKKNPELVRKLAMLAAHVMGAAATGVRPFWMPQPPRRARPSSMGRPRVHETGRAFGQ